MAALQLCRFEIWRSCNMFTGHCRVFLLQQFFIAYVLERVHIIFEGEDGSERLITLAFSAAVGITFLVLGCAIPQYNNWWPMFVLIFYLLSPVPTMMSRRFADSLDTASNACVELCIFLTTGIVISACALPIVLAHRGVIFWGACGLVLSGNVVVFVTILTYFIFFGNEDFDYSMW